MNVMIEEVDRNKYDTEAAAQGEYGELLVNQFFRDNSYEVLRNQDKYGTWDTKITNIFGDTETVQIKACSRFLKYNSFKFHIGKSQTSYDTMRECDHLICVVRHPHEFTDYDYGGAIVKVLHHKKYKVEKDGCLWIKTNNKSIKVLGEITTEELKNLSSFNTHRI